MLIPDYRYILFAVFLLFSHFSLAGDLGRSIATGGNDQGVPACVSCHGADGGGMANSGFPRLAALNTAYIEKQLHDFATAKRKNSVMQPVAKSLSEDEIKSLAAYFAKMPVPVTVRRSSSNDMLIKAGRKLAENGAWSKDIPACFTCHGENGSGIGDHFPALAGQHALYIEQQLHAWRSGLRNNDPNQLMKGIAMRLSDVQIKSVSAYLASLAKAGH